MVFFIIRCNNYPLPLQKFGLDFKENQAVFFYKRSPQTLGTLLKKLIPFVPGGSKMSFKVRKKQLKARNPFLGAYNCHQAKPLLRRFRRSVYF